MRTIDQEGLVELARQHGVVLRLGLRPGDSVVRGTPVASAFPVEAVDVDVDALSDGLARFCATTSSWRARRSAASAGTSRPS